MRLLDENELKHIMAPLYARWQREGDHTRPSSERRPVHLLVGGAHRFKAGTTRRMGEIALATLDAYAPDAITFARAMDMPGAAALSANVATTFPVPDSGARLAKTVYQRVWDKLQREPVESYRIDFEDGYGVRPDDEEDAVATRAAEEVVRGMEEDSLPAELGIRIKSFTPESLPRAVRTLRLFLDRLLADSAGRLPTPFVVTLPKVSYPAQVTALTDMLEAIETNHDLIPGVIGVELMVETPSALVADDGRLALSDLVRAARGRCRCVHFGAYDYTAALGIAGSQQTLHHPLNTVARHLMQLSLAGPADAGIRLADSPTMALPIPVHRGASLTEAQREENRRVVHRAWRACYAGVAHSLSMGFYQGWDIHPNQLPARYAAVFTFFRQDLAANTRRLHNYIQQAGGATRVGDVFDDAATVRALFNTFRQAYLCGAITSDEVAAAGLALESLVAGDLPE